MPSSITINLAVFTKISIKKQLYLGFSTIIILLVLSAGLVLEVLSNTYQSFDRYREMARDANLMGRVQANLLLARTQAKDYFVTGDHEDVLAFQHYYERMRRFVDEAQVEINDPDRAKAVDLIDDDTKNYSRTFSKLIEFTEQRELLIRKNLLQEGSRAYQQIASLQAKIESSPHDEFFESQLNQIMIAFLNARTATASFLASGKETDFNESLDYFSFINKAKADNADIFASSAFTAQISNITITLKSYEQALFNIHDLTIKRNKVIALLNTLGPEISQVAEDIKLEIKAVQDTLGPAMVQNNQSTFKYIWGLATFVILITILIAIRIPRTIVQSLEQLKSGVFSFLAFLRQEKQEADPIAITGNNEFSQIADVLNDNMSIAADVINKKQQVEAEKNQALREMAITDSLTGLYNRRYFDELAVASFNRTKRFNNFLVLFILDIDHFKQYNDNYGHAAGDTALQAVASTIKHHLKRTDDLVFRLGGEEFGGFGVSEKIGVADDVEYIKQICHVIEALKIPHKYSEAAQHLTVSVGIRVIDPSKDLFLTLDQAYTDADQALYLAKQTGRNKAVIFDEKAHS
jgi:diguanylate cyclase (GGDEF)-like protein